METTTSLYGVRNGNAGKITNVYFLNASHLCSAVRENKPLEYVGKYKRIRMNNKI